MPAIEHLQSITLDLPPSCIEFCSSYPRYAVIGTYNLEKQDEHEIEEDEGQRKTQQRNGSLILLQVHGDHVYALLNRFDF
jgi:diphthamide biosynthesis protein 7